MARAPAMAILLSKRGMSMGNTCQLPIEVRGKQPAMPPTLFSRRTSVRLRLSFSVVRFSPLLHNPCLLSTGSTQAEVALELRSKATAVHSLSRQL